MTLLYLIRHGRTTWNDEGRMQGWADPGLDALGRQQAQALARRLYSESFAAIHSSPLARARETAEAVAAGHRLRVIYDERLRERNLGDWTGLTFEEARQRDPDVALSDWRIPGPPGGESQAQLMARVAAAIDEIAGQHPENTVGIVSHGGALTAYLEHLLGIPVGQPVSFSFHNTAIARISLRLGHGHGYHVRVLSIGDDHHLNGLGK
jgi:broad specificity phosphatase PhoE